MPLVVCETLRLTLMKQLVQALFRYGLLVGLGSNGVCKLFLPEQLALSLLNHRVLGRELIKWRRLWEVFFINLFFTFFGERLSVIEVEVIQMFHSSKDSVGSQHLFQVENLLIVLPVGLYFLICKQILLNVYLFLVE